MSDLTPDRGASGDDRRPTDDRVKAARPGRAVLPGEVVLPIDKDRSSTDHRGDGTAADPGAATRRDTTAGTAGTAGSAGAVGTAGTAGAAGPTGAKPRPLTPETVTDADTSTGASTGTNTGTSTGTLGAKGREPGSASASGSPVPPITAPTAGPSSSTASAPSGTPVEREAHAATTATASSSTSGEHGGASLFPEDECDRISARMRHAVVGFVDGPRDAVAEADEVLEELAARLTDAVDRRRRTLRGSWHQPEGGKDRAASAATAVDTEQLRLALRDYRELTERLLHL